VYVQKPLARTVDECRRLREAARKYKVATQMGNQGYSNEGTRQCAEMIWAGEIGNVTEVHAWTNRPVWPQGLPDLPPEGPVPSTFDWDLWLGIASMRPYSEKYAPFNWRGFWDFGCGSLGDMACHILGAPNLALQLGSPTSVECLSQERKSKYQYPASSTTRFEFPARGSMPPVRVTWYDNRKVQPEIAGVPQGEILGDLPRRRMPGGPGGQQQRPPEASNPYVNGQIFSDEYLKPGVFDAPADRPQRKSQRPAGDANARLDAQVNRMAQQGSNGSLFIGDKGMITTGTYGENTRLVPMVKMQDYKWPSRFLTRSPGHYRDWLRACKGGEPSCSNFDVAAPFTEWMLLGVIALHFEGKLEWDAAKGQFSNNKDANDYLKPFVRSGWKLPG
jgi:predicted dehydrogenase